MNASARLLSPLAIVLSLSISVFSQTPTPPVSSSWPPPGVHRYDERGLRPPKLIHNVAAQYTAEAMRAGIEGSVCLEAVVDVNGHVAAVHIARSLDVMNGLDEQAVRALEKWQFTPAFKDGEAVATLISVHNAFTMGKKKSSSRDDCQH
ncbi:MAG TPA: energy transducer TonB [Vicinamibacterales bacterium]|nr:energy transducer TonB [Vicinamibacterales bacterium]